MLYNKFPTPTSSSVQQQRELRREIVRLKQELKATSAQDQFAKWAKLQRQHDKVVQEHDAKGTFHSSLQFSCQIERLSFYRVPFSNVCCPQRNQCNLSAPPSTGSPGLCDGCRRMGWYGFYNGGTESSPCSGWRRRGCRTTSSGF